jgi:hypothetical protein
MIGDGNGNDRTFKRQASYCKVTLMTESNTVELSQSGTRHEKAKRKIDFD